MLIKWSMAPAEDCRSRYLFSCCLFVNIEAKFLVMHSKGIDSIQRGSSRSDAVTIRVGHGKGDGGEGDPADPLSPGELPLIKLRLLRAGSSEDYGVPCRNSTRVPDGQPKAVP